MTLDHRKVYEILNLVRQCFPHWTGFADPRYQKGEVEYKRRSIRKAGEQLSEVELRRLIAATDYDTVISRLDRLGKDNNLLWLRVPAEGDLQTLYHPSLDRPSFCQAVLDLIYGPGPSPERLGRYAGYLESHGLRNYWTFPTYFLFLCHPDTDIFVKPSSMKWFLEFAGRGGLPAGPTPVDYSRVLELAADVREALHEYGPQDMVDIHSVAWLCYPRNGYPRLAAPFNEIFYSRQEAEWAFDFMEEAARRLGGQDAADPRFAYTLTHRYGRTLHMNFDECLLMGFREPGGGAERVRIPLLPDQVDLDEKYVEHRFKDIAPVVGYGLPMEMVRPLKGALRQSYEAALDHAAQKLRAGSRSLHRQHHVPAIAEALFDREKRAQLLSQGLPSTETATLPVAESGVVALLRSRPQVVLQGAPGTGKTHNALLATAEMLRLLRDDAASTREALRPYQLATLLDQDPAVADDPQRLARKVRETGHGLWDIVQLHPSYTYEDFVRGLRVEPQEGRVAFRAVNRILGLLAETAALLAANSLPVVLILDEINRGDLSKVLGELIYALEYREESVLTPYEVQSRLDISLPPNLYLIGTMNTADRSIALVDYAIRRRFYFITLRADREVLAQYYDGQPALSLPALALFDAVAGLFRELQTGYDPRDLAVGHTYFMTDSYEALAFKFVYDVVPLLREYQREGLLEHLALNIDGLEIDLARGSQSQLLAQVRTWLEKEVAG